ncbi:MAG: aspartate carbamoyltransferase catalytic subunit [Dehalococcoidia bacterium]|nr:aspartate carbamoyltransferase catalytic subunit [Dehalococcoidia bacterium]
MLELSELHQETRTEEAVAWHRKDLLDTDCLSPAEIELVMETAAAMDEVRSRPVGKVATLRGCTVVTLFYEQSTRTRASFEVAAKAMGADVVNMTASGSSVEKGESLIDTVRTLEAIGADVVVMRHGRSGAPYLAARNTSASIVNGGDGTHAHPTQALLDLYTMRRHVGDLAGKKVVIVGDILHSRVARSNIWTLMAQGAEVVLCGPATLLPRTLAATGERGSCTVTTNFDDAVEGADVVMALRMQKERQQGGLIASIRDYIRGYQLNSARLDRARPGALVMHPGPMNEGIEIAPEVAHGLASVIEEQVSNGVSVRMAVLYLLTAGRRAHAA